MGAMLGLVLALVGYRALEALCTEYRLTVTGYTLLGLLTAGPQAVGELSALAGMPLTTVLSSLERLDALGAVTRERSRADRRVIEVNLTPHGRALVGAVTAGWLASYPQLREQAEGPLGVALEHCATVRKSPQTNITDLVRHAE